MACRSKELRSIFACRTPGRAAPSRMDRRWRSQPPVPTAEPLFGACNGTVRRVCSRFGLPPQREQLAPGLYASYRSGRYRTLGMLERLPFGRASAINGSGSGWHGCGRRNRRIRGCARLFFVWEFRRGSNTRPDPDRNTDDHHRPPMKHSPTMNPLLILIPTVLLAQSGVTTPSIGFILDRTGGIRPVSGLAGNFLVQRSVL